MTFDMSQFHQIFFAESYEGLDLMEQALLSISHVSQPDNEVINTIFRAAHSIKGGSATMGFSAMADFTHVLETLLDEVRSGTLKLDKRAINLLLTSCDCLRSMIASQESGADFDNQQTDALKQQFKQMLSNNQDTLKSAVADTLPAKGQAYTSDQPEFPAPAIEKMEPVSGWRIEFSPQPQILQRGNEPLRLFRELGEMGELKVTADTSQVPTFFKIKTDECSISWILELKTQAPREKVTEVFDWVLDECRLEVVPLAAPPVHSQPERPSLQSQPEQPSQPRQVETYEPKQLQTCAEQKTTAPPTVTSSSSIRVDIDKIDNLINLVGELVITQSMLSELGNDFSIEKLERLTTGLEQLQQNTRELQESAMQIRMLPISFAFNRFPRMIRDLSERTGKKINLILSGKQTELDKTVLEQMNDPLVHLVRNAADHGIELPDLRRASGKDEVGNIELNAYHKGSNIVIEITDDGQGINADKILTKAIEKGIVTASAQLSEQQIYELIFEPGFTTAESVSDLSGRGVGMDVVRRNIKSLGGRLEVNSMPGKGSTFRVYLPLTLSILDGQLVRVGEEVYIIPLIAIVESLQIKKELVNKVSGNMVLYRLREENIPIIPIYREFDIQAEQTELKNSLLVVVEGDGHKVGLQVDDLLALQQVVIKSLENNYQRIEGISGATILGDGSVALILDIPGLIQRAAKRARKGKAA